jgi:hypothetical protein
MVFLSTYMQVPESTDSCQLFADYNSPIVLRWTGRSIRQRNAERRATEIALRFKLQSFNRTATLP